MLLEYTLFSVNKLSIMISLRLTIVSGGFLAGLIIPKENGFSIALVEKIEDLVTILFLPLVSIIHVFTDCN